MINFNDLKEFNKQNKRINGFRLSSFRYHNKNNSGGNFAINYIKGEFEKEGYKNYELEGEYKTDFTFKYLRVGITYKGLGRRLNLIEINTLSDLLNAFNKTIAEEEKTQEFLRKGNEENEKEREQAENNTLQATTTNENNEVKGLDSEEQEILNELSHFTGTTNYFNASMLYNLKLTDGINFLRNKLNCYWLIDIVGSVQNLDKIKENKGFIVWQILVKKNKSFIVRAYSDYSSKDAQAYNKKYLLYEQKGEYTDFAIKRFEFYQENEVLLLKGEH